MNPTPSLDDRIAIVGAGPAGLSTAWFLKKKGYKNVTVLEKLGRIGGLCKTITEDYQSYDLGANYITLAYRETMKLAREVGAQAYTEPPYTALVVPEDRAEKTHFESFVKAILFDDETKKPFSIWTAMKLGIKYTWLRWRLSRLIDKPTFAGLRDYKDGELCSNFYDWMRKHKLEPFKRLFEIPITMMGYNQLDNIATPYALKYMSLRTFVPMILRGVPIISWFIKYPKRFKLGFQRMWQQVGWQLNVRLNIDIRKIERRSDGIEITFTKLEQILNKIEEHPEKMTFDHLILACPLSPKVLCPFLDMTTDERELFQPVVINSYTMTTLTVNGLNLHTPIAPVVPLTPVGTPWAVVQQWKDKGSYLTQFYTMADTDAEPPEPHRCVEETENDKRKREEEHDRYEKEIFDAIETLVGRMGGSITSPREEWRTYDRWPYFQHVSAAEFKNGFYDKLESQQGKRNTYFVGGPTNFELIEPIVCYSKNLVDTHF